MKTSELTGVALDWAVAKCEGQEPVLVRGLSSNKIHLWKTVGYDPTPWVPSTDWAQGGPIIEREKISLERDRDLAQTFKHWVASKHQNHYMISETPLIAAMRCYVASKLGDEVDVPEELK